MDRACVKSILKYRMPYRNKMKVLACELKYHVVFSFVMFIFIRYKKIMKMLIWLSHVCQYITHINFVLA